MSSDPSLAIQKAIYNVLHGSAFQTACGVTVGVYDHVPQAARPPYVVISDIQVDGDGAGNYDPSIVHAHLTVWSNKPGKVELFTIAGLIRDYLAPRSDRGPPFSLSTDGHRLVTYRHQQTIPMNDADGISTKATVMIEFKTEPLT